MAVSLQDLARRVVNQLYTLSGALITTPATGSVIGLADPDTGTPIDLASMVRVQEKILAEIRITNQLLFQLKEPGGNNLSARDALETTSLLQ